MTITMNIEEETNKETWWVLQKIKKKHLLSPDGYVEFKVDQSGVNGIPTPDAQRDIIEKLQSEGALRIKNTDYGALLNDSFIHGVVMRAKPLGFLFEILSPKFGEVYKKYEKSCDPNTYINASQDEDFKSYEKSKTIKPFYQGLKFSQIEPTEENENEARVKRDKFHPLLNKLKGL